MRNTIAEDDSAPVAGNLLANDTDPDTADTLTVVEIDGETDPTGGVVGSYGSLAWDSDGSYSFLLDNSNASVQALAVGETISDVFSYTLTDGLQNVFSTLTVTITGTNDVPVASDDAGTISEDTVTPLTGDVLANDIDVDATDVLIVTELAGSNDPNANVTGTFGTLSWNDDGSFSYTLDNSLPTVQTLAVGESLEDAFGYSVGDHHGGVDSGTLRISIQGTNDVPTANADVDTIDEDAAGPATGNLLTNDNDPDSADILSVTAINTQVDAALDVTGNYGTLDWNPDGSYSYAVDNANPAVQALAIGHMLTEVFDYSMGDGQGGTANSTLTVTINGTNDAPVAVADINTIAEDTITPVAGNVLVNDTDVDSGDTLNVTELAGLTDVTLDALGTFGTLNWDTDGGYGYELDNANATVQALGIGQTLLDSFAYTATDNHGSADAAVLSITITGTNDAPVAEDDSATTETNASVIIAVTDNDHGHRRRYAVGCFRKRPSKWVGHCQSRRHDHLHARSRCFRPRYVYLRRRRRDAWQ